MESKLSIPVERVRPVITLPAVDGQKLGGSPAFATKYATVIGLLNLEICHADERKRGRKSGWSSRYISQFVNWLRDLS
jgi:hypothetical protein